MPGGDLARRHGADHEVSAGRDSCRVDRPGDAHQLAAAAVGRDHRLELRPGAPAGPGHDPLDGQHVPPGGQADLAPVHLRGHAGLPECVLQPVRVRSVPHAERDRAVRVRVHRPGRGEVDVHRRAGVRGLLACPGRWAWPGGCWFCAEYAKVTARLAAVTEALAAASLRPARCCCTPVTRLGGCFPCTASQGEVVSRRPPHQRGQWCPRGSQCRPCQRCRPGRSAGGGRRNRSDRAPSGGPHGR